MLKVLGVCAVASAALWAPAARAQGYRIGDVVQCSPSQSDRFAKGRIVAIEPRAGWPDPFYMVVLDGDRDPMRCLAKFMKPGAAAVPGRAAATGATPPPPARPPRAPVSQAAPRAPAGTLCRKGAKLEAAWGISWYAATVLNGPNANGQCPVHYDGYDSLYDNAVAEEFLRPTGSGPIVRPARPVAGQAAQRPASQAQGAKAVAGGKAPNGTYSCNKISPSGPMLNLGTMTVSGGTPSFRGLPANFTVRNIGYQGKDYRGRDLVVIDYSTPAGVRDRIDCVK